MSRRVYRSLLTVEPLRAEQIIAAADDDTRALIASGDFERMEERVDALCGGTSLPALRAAWALMVALALAAGNQMMLDVYCAAAALDLGGAA